MVLKTSIRKSSLDMEETSEEPGWRHSASVGNSRTVAHTYRSRSYWKRSSRISQWELIDEVSKYAQSFVKNSNGDLPQEFGHFCCEAGDGSIPATLPESLVQDDVDSSSSILLEKEFQYIAMKRKHMMMRQSMHNPSWIIFNDAYHW